MMDQAKWRKSVNITTTSCLEPAFLKMLKTCGFDGIDLNFSSAFFDEEQKWQLEAICANLQEAGLKCAQVHLPTYGLFADSGEDDPEMERRIETALRIMPALGAKWGAFHMRSAVKHDFDRKKAFKDNAEKLKHLCAIAEQYDVGIAVENLPTFPDRPDAPFFSSRIEDQYTVIDAVDHPLLGACWDFGHANLNIQHKDRTQRELITQLGSRIKIVHVHNNYSTRDSHLPPSIGSIDWNDAIAGLKETGFSGYFSLECGSGPGNFDLSKAYCAFCAETTDILLRITGGD